MPPEKEPAKTAAQCGFFHPQMHPLNASLRFGELTLSPQKRVVET